MHSRRNHCIRYHTLFLGNCYFCNSFGLKATNCKACVKYGVNKDNYFSKANYMKNNIERSSKTMKENFNTFIPLKSDIECQNCCNYGHKTKDCTNWLSYTETILSERDSTKFWQKEPDQRDQEAWSLALNA